MIVHVLVDDLGYADLGYIDPLLATPTIDKLRYSGIVSTHQPPELVYHSACLTYCLCGLGTIELLRVEVLQPVASDASDGSVHAQPWDLQQRRCA